MSFNSENMLSVSSDQSSVQTDVLSHGSAGPTYHTLVSFSEPDSPIMKSGQRVQQGKALTFLLSCTLWVLCEQLTVYPLRLLHMSRLQKEFVRLHLDLQFHKLSDTFLIPVGRFFTLYVALTPAK